MTEVRVAAARALLAIERGGTTLGAALDDHRGGVPPRDRGLLVELVTGVLRWRNALDAVVGSASRRSAREIEPDVRAVLRLGTYQLRYLDRVPDRAVVHSSVAAVRTLGHASATGLVNAVLRSIIRRGPAIALPARPSDGAPLEAQVRYLTTTLSHPAWLVRRWLERLGFDATEAWCRYNNTPPEVTVRSLEGLSAANLIAQLADTGIRAEPAPWVTDAVRLRPGMLGDVPAGLRGRLWVQDEAAQLVARMAAVKAGERVIDLCASPGGKTLVMAEDLDCGRDTPSRPVALVASDYRPNRVALLCDTLSRAHRHVPVVQLDARVGLPFLATFDCALLDAPCSGLGTLRREPDLKWVRTAADLPVFAAAQLQMLRSAADAIRPGGRIVYATCSSEPEENTDVVDRFLADDSRFIPHPVDDGRVPADVIDPRGQLVTRPDRHGLEAFYAAVLVRRVGP